jgi:histidyl-tRNA synthetase
MRIKPVKGTDDFLPNEAALREYMQNIILSTYRANGFERIIAPVLEDAENLDKSDGGENLNLIFRILKRGQKLTAALDTGTAQALTDLGLRYDLTLPLCRYYSNRRQLLLSPFKCIQIGEVYRAENPQKGRSRELLQCDIDIIGSTSINCEIELINVTAKALLNLELGSFKVKINDRRVLNAVLLSAGFTEAELPGVCIALDKLDKIDVDGVIAELYEKMLLKQCIEALRSILCNPEISLQYLKDRSIQPEVIENLDKIINTIKTLSEGQYEIVFDLFLVRGQGYYTGTVFEIESADFGSAVAGGGRYDNLIGKFTNENIPAVGFSIGFERIFCILKEKNTIISTAKKRIGIIYDCDFIEADRIAENFRQSYDVTLYEKPKKLRKLIVAMSVNGFYGVYICGKTADLEVFDQQKALHF